MGRTKSELEALAVRHGWKPRALSAAELTLMSANEYEYHSAFNAQELERAVTEPTEREKNKARAKYWDAKNVWTGNVPIEKMAEKYFADQQRFRDEHSQVIWNYQPNLEAFGQALIDKNLEPTYGNLEHVFADLVQAGKLLLSLRACGRAAVNPRRHRELLTQLMRERKVKNNRLEEIKISEEAMQLALSELSDEFSNIADLLPAQVQVILSPVTSRPQETQSAAEYKREHAADFEQPATALEIKSIEKLLLTVTTHHPEIVLDEALKEKIAQRYKGPVTVQGLEAFLGALRDAGELTIQPDKKISGEVLRYTDMGGDMRGFPDYAGMSKYSFRALVEGMSAAQLAEPCRQDARFKAALDALD